MTEQQRIERDEEELNISEPIMFGEINNMLEFEIVNKTDRKFNSADGENARVYVYKDGEKLTIDQPAYVSEDNEVVIDGNRITHYPRKGWLCIEVHPSSKDAAIVSN